MKQNIFQRNCPLCNKIINYSNIYAMRNAEKKKSNCKSCSIKLVITDEVKQKMSDRVTGSKNPMFGMYGEKNPFYGKKHKEETIKKFMLNRDYTNYKTDEFREKISKLTSGENNPMFGKSVYNVWVEKYGVDIANEKMKEYKSKQSKNNSGEKNSMFGKPSPNGSGNGWSGWYKNWFFRSILELSYMINVIEKYNLPWKNAECDKYTIDYIDYNNNKRTYRADFIIADKYLVELKPKKLWEIRSVKLKICAAKNFCEVNNMIYKIREVPKISNEDFLGLINRGEVKLIDRYEKKLVNWSL